MDQLRVRGSVSGFSADYTYAIYNLANGSIQTPTLSLPPGEYLEYLGGINAAGTIAGTAEIHVKTRHYKYQPFEQDASGNVTLLHKLTTFPYAPVGISDSGEIAISAYYHNALVKNAKFKL